MPLEPPLLYLAGIAYLLLVWLFLRSEQLVGVYKWLFSLAFMPTFLFLMFANIWIVDHIFPNLLNWHQSLGGGSGGSVVAFLMTAAIPVSVCWLWYALFVRLSQRQSKMPTNFQQ